jgi:hypothetical protein
VPVEAAGPLAELDDDRDPDDEDQAHGQDMEVLQNRILRSTRRDYMGKGGAGNRYEFPDSHGFPIAAAGSGVYRTLEKIARR